MATYYEMILARVSQARSTAQETATGIKEHVSAHASAALSAVRDAKATSVAHALALRDFAVNTLNSVQEKGLRIWCTEAAWALRVAAGAQARLLDATARQALADASAKTRQGADMARVKACHVSKATREIVSQKSFQATAGSAVGGAVALGTGGGATGLAAGGAVGALAGLPLALFTFGLSVPVGAAIGGGAGLVAGAAAGATAGAVGGGAAGYGAFAKRAEIAGAARYVASKAGDGANRVKDAAQQSVEFTKGKASDAVSVARARFGRKGMAEKVEVMSN